MSARAALSLMNAQCLMNQIGQVGVRNRAQTRVLTSIRDGDAMIKTSLILNTKQLDNLQAFVRAYPDYANDIAQTVFTRYQGKLIDELRHAPAKPKYPIQWQSERQRKAFFATNGFGGGIPYRRTGKLTRSWYAWVRRDGNRIDLNIANKTPYAPFVVGDISPGRRKDPMQRMHKASGWQPVAPSIQFWVTAYREEFVKEFNKVLGNKIK